MTILDLTHFIEPGMPVYPGTEGPIVESATTIPVEGFAEKRISMYSHTGTHMDAPGHILPGAPTLDRLPPGQFAGPGLVLDLYAPETGRLISESDLAPRMIEIEAVDFLLFRFGWDRFWGSPEYFEGYPILSPGAAEILAGAGLKGIGVDCISVDEVGSVDFMVHKMFFRAGMVLIENLTDLAPLIGRNFTFLCLPLKLRDTDGSPVRAAAMVSD